MSTLKVDGIRSNSATSDAITLASNGTCTANITNNLSNRNLIINGAMQVAQRGTSSTANTFGTVDRFSIYHNSADEAPTQAQADVASGTTPYTLGFRKAFKLTNGNQTGVGTSDILWIQHIIEAQNIANSGWNYTDTNSFITLSFWIKSSVAQTFKGYLRTLDGTSQQYPFETGSLSADTWTKVTKTIPGNSNLTFDNNNGSGLQINIIAFYGTSGTSNSVTEDAWGAYSSSARMEDNTSTWWTTNDATLEITGVQLEVGSVATDFEHRSFAQELALCQRYYYRTTEATTTNILNMAVETATAAGGGQPFPTTMRASPSITFGSGLSFFSAATSGTTFSLTQNRSSSTHLAVFIGISGGTAGQAGSIFKSGSDAYIEANAEL